MVRGRMTGQGYAMTIVKVEVVVKIVQFFFYSEDRILCQRIIKLEYFYAKYHILICIAEIILSFFLRILRSWAQFLEIFPGSRYT